jgi:glycosyltransferase involved in cell wall biosynthesis
LFLPYLYGTTIDGLPVVEDKSLIVPCLHDEAYAYLDVIRDLFRQARGLLFNSEGELNVAASLYGPWVHARAHVIGHAVDLVDVPTEQISIKGFAPHRSRYLLYLGRGDRTKNLDLALDAFVRFREKRRSTALQLVIAGPHASSLRSVDGITDLGVVTDKAKAILLANGRALIQPSINESFSRTVYEAWHMRRPVVVHADCPATAGIVRDSGGGWIASTVEEWATVFAEIDESSDGFIDGIGLRGRGVALELGTWDDVAARTVAAIDEHLGRLSRPCIEQVVPLDSHEAIAHATALDAALQSLGCESSIRIDGAAGAEVEAHVVRHVVLADSVAPAAAYISHTGHVNVPSNSYIFSATSEVALTLSEQGIVNRLLPTPVDPALWVRARPNERRYDDGAINILSLVPFGPADAKEIIEVLALLRRKLGTARLLVLEGLCSADAIERLIELCAASDLRNGVTVISDSIDARFAALRDAHVACALGAKLENPDLLINAMWFDLPIIAYDDPVANDIVEAFGIVCDRKEPRETAAVLYLLTRDKQLRTNIIAEGQRVRLRYAPRPLAIMLIDALELGRPATGKASNVEAIKNNDR